MSDTVDIEKLAETIHNGQGWPDPYDPEDPEWANDCRSAATDVLEALEPEFRRRERAAFLAGVAWVEDSDHLVVFLENEAERRYPK